MDSPEISKDTKTDEGIYIKPKVGSVLHDKRSDVYFHIGKNIGQGGFATCYEATVSLTGKLICCKTIWKAKLKNESAKLRVRTEVSIHRKMNHPNIVKYYTSMEDKNFVYFFMEICRNGTLKDLLFYRKILTEPEIRFYMLQLLSALEYFMENRVIHRDLKLANIFVAEDMTLRIGDFGLAGQLEAGQNCRTTRCGTPNYTAPEVLDQVSHSYEVDMWALGIIMYTLLIGTPPFQAKGGLKETYFKIRTLDLNFPPNVKISSEARDLVTVILRIKPEERPDFHQVRSHSFFQGFTPTSLSKDALHKPPQFSGDHNLVLKRGLNTDGVVSPSAVSGLSTPHKTARFGTAHNRNSPTPLPKVYCFKELEEEAPTSLVQETELKCNQTSQAVLPAPQFAECSAEKSVAEEGSIETGQPQQEDKPLEAVTNTTIIQDAHNVYVKIKELIALGKTVAQIEDVIGEADLTIPNFISKWVFHGEHYGQVYEFIDGTICMLFPDLSTLTLAPDNQHLEYIENQGGQCPITCYTRAEFQKVDSRKLMYFDRMIKGLKATTSTINNDLKHALLPAFLQTAVAISGSTPRISALPYLLKYNRTKYGTFFRLSNSTVQMNLIGDHSFVLSDKGRCLVAIPKKGTAIQSFSLLDILAQYDEANKAGGPVESSLSALHSRVTYFLEIISLVAQRKCLYQPQKSPCSKQS